MSKINIDRSVVEQAIDALGNTETQHGQQYRVEVLAMRALYAALEKPDHSERCLGMVPQIEQEPVAEIRHGTLHWHIQNPAQSLPLELLRGVHPLYLHPQPPRQPLTIEQINALPETGTWWPAAIAPRVLQIIRAVERAHRIGGEA